MCWMDWVGVIVLYSSKIDYYMKNGVVYIKYMDM